MPETCVHYDWGRTAPRDLGAFCAAVSSGATCYGTKAGCTNNKYQHPIPKYQDEFVSKLIVRIDELEDTLKDLIGVLCDVPSIDENSKDQFKVVLCKRVRQS